MLTRTRLIGLLAAVGLAVAPAGAQTLDAPRLTVGGALLPPVDTSVRLDDLGTSGGTLVLFSDTDGDVFERILGKSDLPATVGYTDEAETWSLLQTFTSGLTSNGLLTIGGSNDLLLGTGGIRVASGSINLRNIADGANIATFGDSAITLVQPVTMSSTLGVTGLITGSAGVRLNDGSAGTPAYSFTGDPDTGMTVGSSNVLHLSTGGTSRFNLTNTGGTFAGTLAVTGNTTLTGDLAVNGNDLTSTGVLRITPTGNLTLDPTGDIVLGPTGNDILPNTGYTKNLGALSNKYLTLHAAELWVETLVAQDTIATIGGRVLVGPTTVLTADLGAAATSISVKHNQMASGDRVYLEADGKVEFMAITSAASGTGPYTYTVTRNLDGSGANDWYAGDAMFNTGTTGDGFIDLYSVSGVLSGAGPTIVGNVRTGTTYSNIAPRWAIGNLNALYGYSGDVYGAAFGDASDVWIGVDATNGIRIFEGGSTQRAVWATDGSLTIGSAATNSGNVHISSDAIDLRSGTVSRIQLFASNGQVRVNDPGGTPRVIVDSAYFRIGNDNPGEPNIYFDTSTGVSTWRTGTTNRVYVDSAAVRMFDPAGTRRAWLGDLTGSGSTLSGYGFVFGDSTNANQMFLEYGSTEGDMNFCVAGDTCYLNFDGATGDVTTTGDIIVGSAGNIRGGATAYGTGTGFWIGDDGGTYKLRVGETVAGGNDYLAWSGGALTVSGALISQGGILIESNSGGGNSIATSLSDLRIINTNVTGTLSLSSPGGIQVANSGGSGTGWSGTRTVRASGGASDCTLVYISGLLTGGTC